MRLERRDLIDRQSHYILAGTRQSFGDINAAAHFLAINNNDQISLARRYVRRHRTRNIHRGGSNPAQFDQAMLAAVQLDGYVCGVKRIEVFLHGF